ncbi:APC family permease [Saccharopolyspora sp. NFXS83]|uniref:APC family permease n=1 Tax=Saccharopolyspora sp. NFXS83 TaxID=2993560 RepID=UPI00224B0B47|nr:APC family permease [Saccharopolyspora sp. NFXS83]MCX2729394.1 APC family permease [Saccharopolyspora sp. NFXS83]
MQGAATWLKRLVVGRPVRSDQLAETLLPKRLALPLFASDPFSSVAYASQEILLVLALGGVAVLHLAWWAGAAVMLLLAVVTISYRQVVRAYPSGGGSYAVASENLGPSAGLVVAGALMVDYVLTVSVSVSAGVDNIISAFTELNPYRVELGIGFVIVLTALNLRGMRESGRIFALPSYLFIAGVLVMIATGLVETLVGAAPVAQSAAYDVRPEHSSWSTFALLFLLLRTFASGCTALTGMEAISNGVPAFRRPKAENAAATMAATGLIAITMFAGVTALALISGVHYAENPCDLIGLPGDCANEPQRTVIAQIAAAVFGGTASPGFYYVQATATLILVLAANTAYSGFPLLTSLLARHRYMPRQLHTRGDRLAFSNGIVLLASAAGALIWLFEGSTTRLIQLYILGVFTSFTLAQAGMVRHWNRELASTTDNAKRRRQYRARLINTAGAAMTGLVLAIVLVTKFSHGAYLVVIVVPVLFVLMRGIRRHYDLVQQELEPEDEDTMFPARVHAVVLVSNVHKPVLRALAYARATRPDDLTAITVNVEDADTQLLEQTWQRNEIPVPLKVLESPYREITRPVVQYVRDLRRTSPRDVVIVYIPEYVFGRWWDNALHNQSALRLKTRLRFEPGVMITSVPWQLPSSHDRYHEPERHRPGELRRGITGPNPGSPHR